MSFKPVTITALLLLSIASSAHSATSYNIKLLDYSQDQFRPFSINNNGTMAGETLNEDGYPWVTSSILQNSTRILPVLAPSTSNFFRKINNYGLAVGGINSSDGKSSYGLMYDTNTNEANFYSVPGSSFTYFWGVNDNNDVVGTYSISIEGNNLQTIGFVKNENGVSELALSGYSVIPTAINNNGHVAGILVPEGDDLWVNTSGFIWDGLGFTIIRNEQLSTQIYDMNDRGDVVGYTIVPGQDYVQGFVMSNGMYYDLPAESWHTGDGNLRVRYYVPLGINSNGVIVGQSEVMYSGDPSLSHGFMATQVPEPETYAMMLTGLGLVGFMARRRKLAKV